MEYTKGSIFSEDFKNFLNDTDSNNPSKLNSSSRNKQPKLSSVSKSKRSPEQTTPVNAG